MFPFYRYVWFHLLHPSSCNYKNIFVHKITWTEFYDLSGESSMEMIFN